MRVLDFNTIFDTNQQVLSQRVLVLNRCFLPIHITTVRRAVSLLCLEDAVGIDTEYQTYAWDELMAPERAKANPNEFYCVRSVSLEVSIPKVLILKDFDKRPPQFVRFSRAHIFMRDDHTCQYCSNTLPKQKLNIDHVIPRVQKGKTSWENVVTSCHGCNRKKGGRTPRQAGMKLLKNPLKPKVSPLLLALRQRIESWDPFLSYLES